MESQRTLNSQNNLDQKQREFTLSVFTTDYKATVIQTVW